MQASLWNRRGLISSMLAIWRQVAKHTKASASKTVAIGAQRTNGSPGTRECLAIRVARRINSFGVIDTMADVMLTFIALASLPGVRQQSRLMWLTVRKFQGKNG